MDYVQVVGEKKLISGGDFRICRGGLDVWWIFENSHNVAVVFYESC